jgi:hypothetical protein
MSTHVLRVSTYGLEYSFPAQNFYSLPYFIFGSLRFVYFFTGGGGVLLCRGDAVAVANNSAPYFALAAKFSRPKW